MQLDLTAKHILSGAHQHVIDCDHVVVARVANVRLGVDVAGQRERLTVVTRHVVWPNMHSSHFGPSGAEQEEYGRQNGQANLGSSPDDQQHDEKNRDSDEERRARHHDRPTGEDAQDERRGQPDERHVRIIYGGRAGRPELPVSATCATLIDK